MLIIRWFHIDPVTGPRSAVLAKAEGLYDLYRSGGQLYWPGIIYGTFTRLVDLTLIQLT